MAASLPLANNASAEEKKMPPKITYDEHVKPIFRQKCFSCHSTDKKESDLDLSNYTNLMQGGASGDVVEPGNSTASSLYAAITHQAEPFMPPESPKIPDEMIETVRKWIEGGLLENAGSKALVSNKPKFEMALKTAPSERPAVVPMPARLSLEPVTRTATTTAVSALATSPWAPLAAVAGQKQVLLYNTSTLELLGSLPFPEGIPEVLKFSRNGSLLLAGGGRGGANGRCIVWNVATGERVIEIGDELDAVLAADISSDQTLIALGGPQRVVRIYSTESGRLLHELRKHTDWVCSLEFSPDSVLLASGDRSGGLYVWEGWTGREYLTLKGHTGCVTGVSWRSDSNVVASCSEDTTIKLWEMENGGQIKNWGAHGGGAASVEFARDGRILSCGRDRVTKLWDQNGAQQRAFEAFGELALRVTFCDETNRAIAGDWTGEVRVWNAVDGVRLGALTPNPPKLAERLTAAEQLLVAKTAEHKPVAAAYQVAQAAATKAKTDLATAQKTAAESKTKSDAAAAALNAATQTLTKATSEQQATAKAVTDMQTGLPELKDASAKALEASAKQAADKEIAAAAAALKANLDKRVAELAVSQKTAAEKAAALEKAKADLAVKQKAATEAATALATAQQLVTNLTPLVKPAEDKAIAAKAAADAATAALTAAQNSVNRWKGEIAFTTALTQLETQLKAALTQLGERQQKHADLSEVLQTAQAALDKVKADLVQAQSAYAATQKQVETATNAVNTTKQAMVQAATASEAAVKLVTTLEGVLASLNEAVAKTTEATAKSAGDKELAAAVEQLKKLAAARTAQLDTARNDAVVKAKAVDTAKQQVAAAEKRLTDSVAANEATKKRVADTTALVGPAEAKIAPAKAPVDAAAKEVEGGQKQVDQVKQQILVHRGIAKAG